MAIVLYCWRCKRDVAVLEKHEAERVWPKAIKDETLRALESKQSWARSDELKRRLYGPESLERYFEVTGQRETDTGEIWKHQLSQFGPPCRACQRPLRTPKATFCANCGTSRNA